MYTQRLNLLADFLETVPHHKFNLGNWRHADANSSNHLQYVKLIRDSMLLDMNCGTTACAVGWACTMPEFIERGLHWDAVSISYDCVSYGSNRTMVGWDAVTLFFNISREFAYAFFSDTTYPTNTTTPTEVANRIRKIILDCKNNPSYGNKNVLEDYPEVYIG